MIYDAREFFVNITDGSVTVIRFGRGPKKLLMIPGLRLSSIVGSAKTLAWYYKIFSSEYTVYMFDRKNPVVPGCTIHDLAEDVNEVMDKLDLNDVYLFGASQGGMIAQDLAINHPDKVRKMVLGVTASRPNDTIKAVMEQWIQMARESGLSAVAKDYVYKGFSEDYIRKYKLFMPLAMRMQAFMPVENFIILARACLTGNTYDRLSEIKCPVLVLGGGRDKVVTGEASREIADKLKCECYIYDKLSHEAYNEAGDFNKRIYDFFSK